MRFSRLWMGTMVALAWLMGVPAVLAAAENAPPQNPPPENVSPQEEGQIATGWQSVDSPVAEQLVVEAEGGASVATPTPTPTPSPAAQRGAALGPKAVDEQGREGRIHTVVKGDTLWDISETYLGTPWVWPSVWKENADVENPHLIRPGDRIWVSSGEIRLLSDHEADAMIAASAKPAEPEIELPPADTEQPSEEDLMADDLPASMDSLPVAVPTEPKRVEQSDGSVHVAEREVMGFVSSQAVDASSSIVESSVPRIWLAQGDEVYLGIGEGQTKPGDQFTVYRDATPVHDVDEGALLGYHVEILGWAEVVKVKGESSIAVVRMSESEIQRGDRIIARQPVQLEVPLERTPDGIEGNIVFAPNSRTAMGQGDYVYVNRGSLHGFASGSEVEVYDPGRLVQDDARGVEVMTPADVVASMVLVDVRPDSSVAYVLESHRELQMGDRVRPATERLASR